MTTPNTEREPTIDLEALRQAVQAKASNGTVGALIYTMMTEDLLALLDRLQKAESERSDLAALVRRLCRRLYKHGEKEMANQADDYLARKNLIGNVLRDEAAPTPPVPQAAPVEVERDARYDELIMAVGMKWSGETRHETALRYIRQAERPSGDAAKAAMKGEGK